MGNRCRTHERDRSGKASWQGTRLRAKLWAVGSGAAALIYALTFYLLPENRLARLFFVAIIPALFVFYIRKYVDEPEVFKRTPVLGSERPLARHLLGTSPLYHALHIAPRNRCAGRLLCHRHMAPDIPEDGTRIVGAQHLRAILPSSSWLRSCGYIVGAYLTDAIGRRRTFALFAVGAIITVVLYTFIPDSRHMDVVLGFPIGFCYAGTFAGLGSYLRSCSRPVCAAREWALPTIGRAVGALSLLSWAISVSRSRLKRLSASSRQAHMLWCWLPSLLFLKRRAASSRSIDRGSPLKKDSHA